VAREPEGKDAILQRSGDALVFVVTDGTAEARRVVIGEAVGPRFEVLQGLAAGDLVVVRGNERLRNGAPVKIEEAKIEQGS